MAKALILEWRLVLTVACSTGCLYSAEWNGGMEWWNGTMEWNGMEKWNDHAHRERSLTTVVTEQYASP